MVSQGRLEGKVALVTGAASGIGAATALRFAREGARVAGFDLKRPPSAAWEELEAAAPEALFETGDVTREEEVGQVVNAALDRFGRLDVLMNAAGIAGGGPVHALSEESWDRVLAVNLKGTFLMCKHALKPMLAQESGSIVNVASIEGLQGIDGGSAYNASKGGVVLLTRNLAIEQRVQRVQGRGRAAHTEPRDRLRPQGNPCQLRVPGPNRHADDRRALPR